MARFGKLYDNTRGRLSRVLAAVRREPTGARPTRPVRIKLGDLPAPLRAVVRDESHGGILIEAELPWLTVGSAVQAEFSDGREKAGRVHWFGVDATRAGSARLRIFVDLSSTDAPEGTQLPDLGDLGGPRRSARSWLLATVVLVIVASVVVYVLARRAPQPALLPSPVAADTAPPRAPAPASIPKQPPEAPAAEAAPAPAHAAPAPAHATPSRPRPKRKKR
jgi:hypothetical protein